MFQDVENMSNDDVEQYDVSVNDAMCSIIAGIDGVGVALTLIDVNKLSKDELRGVGALLSTASVILNRMNEVRGKITNNLAV